ncbi:MAG TPA: hypothetical protein VEF04_14615 [Blastocatellia bacterium]|nr:hypothetical protein [Blastocatellia bacterium]
MSENPIPDDVREFILENIDSIGQLEALLLLRSSPGEDWNAQGVAKRLYVSEQDATLILTRLNTSGLIAVKSGKPPLYRYQPSSDDLRSIVDRLAETYSKHLVPVTNLVHSKPRTRIQEFADAFKLRKDE